MRGIKLMVASTVLLAMTSGVGHAAYRSEQDRTVSLTVAPTVISTDGSTGAATFRLQEAAHKAVKKRTGAEVDHYYFWVYINGQPVLAVDPAWIEEE